MDGPGTPSDLIGNSGPHNKYPDKLDSESDSPQPLAVASGPCSRHRHTHSSQTDTTRVEPYPARPASEGCGETVFSPPGRSQRTRRSCRTYRYQIQGPCVSQRFSSNVLQAVELMLILKLMASFSVENNLKLILRANSR